MTTFTILKKYNFDTYAPSMLGNVHKHMVLKQVCDYTFASTVRDIETTHKAILSYLPEGTVRDFRYLTYLIFETPNKEILVLAREWLRPDSIEQVLASTITISLSNVAPTDVTLLREVLTQNGFNAFDIVINDN